MPNKIAESNQYDPLMNPNTYKDLHTVATLMIINEIETVHPTVDSVLNHRPPIN